ncbi:AraC family transcriptional regulator [Bacillaceae bacterium SIJ1]|uniref:helix-turn-helix transcriptional regulator n=1 Tax=Litoribacterium kuwaitense TaxID=1398745 RepID=UPI0013EA57D6|nr:helix-turn-helix domain-containing protein [Litoribacterium kuwaitense]NGP45757.1 AraC family transcriptional regulator [Litoribacterium kuwaitense]
MTTDMIHVCFRRMNEKWTDADFQAHSHERFEIYRFHSGDCKYVIGDRVHTLQPGDIIMMNGLTLHGARPLATKPYERSVLEFSQSWIEPVLKSIQLPELLLPFYKLNNFLFRNVEEDSLREIDHLFCETAALNDVRVSLDRADPQGRLIEGEMATLVTRILIKMYQLSHSRLAQLPPQESEKSKHVDRIVTWIQNSFQLNITLNDIANDLNISKYHMCRIFKEVTGLTVMQYLMSVRLHRAKYLLEMTVDKTVLDIALESGFENASHFSRLFRQQVCMTPSQYRKQKIRANPINSLSK